MKQMLRILFVADVLPDPDSGASGTEFQTIHAMRRRGHEVDEIWADGLPHRIRHPNMHYVFELPRAIQAAVAARSKSRPYDVIHINQCHCFLAAKHHKTSRNPGIVVHRSHGLEARASLCLKDWRIRLNLRDRNPIKAIPGWLIDRRLERHGRWTARHVDGTIVSCSKDRDFLIETYGLDPAAVTCIPQAPAPSFSTVPPTPLCRRRLNRMLYVGNYAYAKGIHAVAQSVSLLLQMNSEARFTWVIPDNAHQQALHSVDPAARDRVETIGWCSQSDLLNMYDQHGILLFPSLFEGFGKVFLEAMSRGLCVVATSEGGMGDIIIDQDNGFLVKHNCPAEIVSIVKHLWDNLEMALEMSGRAAATAAEYSWDRVARETEAFYIRRLSPSRSKTGV